MVKENRAIIVDTYAIIADLTGESTPAATRVLDKVRIGEIRGIIHPLIIYELAYHWKKGRLPFNDEKELWDFVDTYFKAKPITPSIALDAAKIKMKGDQILKNSNDPRLKRRRISISDAITLVFATKYRIPIVTGDIDLTYVAQSIGIKVIW